MYPIAARAFFLTILAGLAACHRAPAADVDLLRVHPPDERRAPGDVDEAIRIDRLGLDAASGLALVVRAPARVTWDITLPRRASFRALTTLLPVNADAPLATATGVTARIGISSGRWYEELTRVKLDRSAEARWQPLDIDLTPYSGPKLSVFYQPPRLAWRLVLSVDATSGGTLALAQPSLIVR